MNSSDVDNKEKLLEKVKATLGKLVSGDLTPDDGDDISNYDGDGLIKKESIGLGDAIEIALNTKKSIKQKKLDEMRERAVQKRKEKKQIIKKAGVKMSTKNSKFNTRSDYFLSEPMRALNIILNQHETEIYKDGSDPCPRLLMGHPAYGKSCKRNPFEHFTNLQKKLIEYRGENDIPPWLIFNVDTSIVSDRNLVTRLEELQPSTGMACAYGFEKVRASGKWYEVTAADQENVRGCYIQASTSDINWDFIVGHKFKQSPRYRVIIAHGPFVAIRGSIFMDIDFKDAAKAYVHGFYHYMAELSMECDSRKYAIATIKSLATQYDSLASAKDSETFDKDQAIFTSRWQKALPNCIPSLKVQHHIAR